jgi:hypothetical protein
MASTITPTTSGFTRVFLIENGARPDHAPDYHAELRAMALSLGFGDSTRIELPDPAKLGAFVEVGEIRGETERPTTQLQGRYPAKTLSDIFRIAKTQCYVDVQIVVGSCNDPRSYDEYDKLIIVEEARITNYDTDDLGALGSGDNAVVNEMGDLSGRESYEVVPISYGVKAASVVTNEVIDVIVCDNVSCGDCEEPSDGCKKIFAITKAAGGSPSTKADIVFSVDKGANWLAHDIETLGAAEDPDAVICIGSYIIVLSEDSGSLHYALKSEFNSYTDPTFTEVATGFVAGKGPRHAWSLGNKAFVVGAGGYIYLLEDPTGGVTVLDAGSVVTSNLNHVHALSEEFAIAVGDGGAVVYTENGSTWAMSPTSPVGIGTDLYTCWAKTESEWFVGGEDGNLYYTLNAGQTWATKTFSGSGAGKVYDIHFATNSVGYLSHATAAPHGRIFRTTNGGYSWKLTPERTGTMPVNDYVGALATCIHDPNFVIGVGLADDGADGFVVVGLGS